MRLGHGAALTCHRHVIHYRAAAALPLKLPRCSLIRALLHMFFDRLHTREALQLPVCALIYFIEKNASLPRYSAESNSSSSMRSS